MARDSYQGVPTRDYKEPIQRGQLYAKRTRVGSHLYISETGNDSNSGLSASEAKATFDGEFGIQSLIPHLVKHFVIVHMTGNISVTGITYLLRNKSMEANVLFDGGTDVLVIDDNGGSNYTADGSGVNSLTVTGAGWTVDEHQRTEVELLSGGLSGTRVACWGNTADTLQLGTMTADPGTSDFRFVKPVTTISGTTPYSTLSCSSVQGDSVYTVLQNVRLVGDVYLYSINNTAGYAFAAVYIETAATTPYSMYMNNSNFYATYGEYDTTTAVFSSSKYKFGLVNTSTSKVYLQAMTNAFIYGSSLACPMEVKSCTEAALGYGTYVDGLVTFTGCTTSRFMRAGAYTGYNIRLKKGVIFDNCTSSDYPSYEAIGNAITINNSAGDAIIIRNSNLKFGAVYGSATGGHSMAVYGNSNVEIVSTPTISGTEGYLTFDGTTTTSGSWAGIVGGSNASNTSKGYSIVQKYTAP